MTATVMHFGPEWMRKQPASAKPNATSPPPSGGVAGHSNGTLAPPGAVSYSALVTPNVPSVQGKRDIANPFKYSREEMLQFYKDGGGCSELPIEVERWEGIVRGSAGEPVCLSDFTEAERKLYASSLNSELRRRQSTDYMAQGDRSKGVPLNSNLGLMGRRRRGDSNGADHPPLSLPRKTSWSGTSGNLASPSLVSPRSRMGSGSGSGFDGVLNGNDTAWGGGKRRVPSGQLFSGRVDEEEEVLRDPELFEAKEDVYAPYQDSEGAKSHLPHEPDPESPMGPPQDLGRDLKDTTVSLNNLTLNTNVGAPQGIDLANGGGQDGVDLTDLAKLQWSYVDPSGNVQGPFPGETMQLWHDQHYFTDNLMMKRTAVDTEFIPLAEIKRRAQGDRIFLSPLNNNVPPPGLGHLVPGPGLNSLLQRTGVMDSPRQPSPQAYGRSSTLDSFINAGSAATGSASPSSSFGGNFARGPILPDPVAIGSRLQRLASDVPLSGRISAAGSYSSNGSPAMPQTVRHIFNESLQPNRSSSFDAQSNIPWQVPQGNGIQGWSGSSDVAQLSQPGRLEQIVASPVGHSPFMREVSPYVVPGGPTSVDPFLSSSAPSRKFYEQSEQVNLQANRPDMPGGSFQQASNGPPLRFEGAPQQLSLPQLSTDFNHDLKQAPSPVVALPSAGDVQHQAQTRRMPWGAPQTREPPRPRPFDSDRPTSSNTFVVSLPQTLAWNGPQADVRPLAAQDPWSSSLHTNNQEGRGQSTEESQSLTTANVIQHNEQQGLLHSRSLNAPFATEPDTSINATIDAADSTPAAISLTSVPPVSSPKESAIQPSASKHKINTAVVIPTPVKGQSAISGPAPKVPAASPAPQKTAWSTDDDNKAKQTPAPMNLREIQEVERNRQEARKTAEKERERAARAAASASSAEEVQFTASWGLPTSQVGARSNGVPATKNAPTLSPTATTSAPVWTNAAKPAAKTMKEIQEEEERRKQTAKEKETIASAVKRVAQAPAVRGPLANTQSTGGAWSVVGSGGKVSMPAGVVAARPTQSSTPNIASARPAALVSATRLASSPLVAKAAPATPKIDDEPGTPSPEFMKWMRESLRGLNSSVQFEEIAQMLLSFPLDPDDATKELIAETVYGASTTLNGRRFVIDFVDKRKEDAHSRPRGGRNQAANGRAVSLADVVKAQPKQTQNEFGSFKVVKKKNKRS